MLDRLQKFCALVEKYYPLELYDHRPFLNYPEKHAHIQEQNATEEYRIKYACFRRAITATLRPKSIIEIGVRGGVSALAFLDGMPHAKYLGIDNNLDGLLDGVDYLGATEEWFKHFGYDATIVRMDTQKIYRLPETADFIHIDGCHTREGAAHDITLALDAGIPWILVDDTAAESVHSGVMDAICNRDPIGVHEFFDVQGGSILLYEGKE